MRCIHCHPIVTETCLLGLVYLLSNLDGEFREFRLLIFESETVNQSDEACDPTAFHLPPNVAVNGVIFLFPCVLESSTYLIHNWSKSTGPIAFEKGSGVAGRSKKNETKSIYSESDRSSAEFSSREWRWEWLQWWSQWVQFVGQRRRRRLWWRR